VGAILGASVGVSVLLGRKEHGKSPPSSPR